MSKCQTSILFLVFLGSLSACGSKRPGRISTTSGAQDAQVSGPGSEFFGNKDTEMAKKRIFRLTQTQFDETIKFLLPGYTQDSISKFLAIDPKQTNYDYSDFLLFNTANYTPYSQWTAGIAAKVTADPAKLINCPAALPVAACHREAAGRFVHRAFRGAVDAATEALYVTFFTDSFTQSGKLGEAAGELVTNVLMSPYFSFRTEFSTDKNNLLIPGEFRQNLAYTLADAPLEELLGASADKAEAGDPIAKAMAAKQVRQKLQRFFIDWLEIKKPSEFRISTEAFPEFTEAMATEAVAETNKFLEFYLATPSPKLSDLIRSRKTFVSSAIKSVYAEDDNKGEAVEHDPKKRMGLFTQSAFIASRSGPITSNIIKRGVFFMRKVMCLDTGMLPGDIDTTIAESEGRTERERVEAKTGIAPCVSCHVKINPFGFAFENFDAIGRWRTTENNIAIDPSVSMAFLSDEATTTNSPVEALDYFTGTDRFKQCFVRQVFRYYMGRNELASDDPVLKDMYQHLSDKDEDILGLLQTMVTSQRFNKRN